MRFAALAVIVSLVGLGRADEPKPLRLTFEQAALGELPKGWSAAKTGKGDGSVWKIVEAPGAPGTKALAQTSAEGSGPFYSLCLADGTSYADIDATFLFKAVAGQEDQGGGLLWRCKDADNYYVARFNPLENNFRFYKVVAGKRSPPLGDAKVTLARDAWHSMRIVHQGEQIRCYLDGKLHIDVKDSSFTDAGKIGFWTKADAQTWFADLRIAGK